MLELQSFILKLEAQPFEEYECGHDARKINCKSRIFMIPFYKV